MLMNFRNTEQIKLPNKRINNLPQPLNVVMHKLKTKKVTKPR